MITTNDSRHFRARRGQLADRLRRLLDHARNRLRRRHALTAAQAAAEFQGDDDTTVPRTIVLPLEVDRDLANWVRDTTVRAASRRLRGALAGNT